MPDARAPEVEASELEAFELTQAQWPAVERSVRRLLVMPVGSLEQHGPHLPLDTDTRIAVAVARRACAGRPGVALAPPLPVGASGEHAAFPGTLSIGSEALAACLIELGRHASLHWPALLLVNAHGGNVTAVDAAVGRLRYEGRACLAWHAALPEGDAHAGRSETSIMLALTARTPRSRISGRISARGRTSPRSAAPSRTAPGSSASMTEVSDRPACASPPGSAACQARQARPS